MPAKAKKNKGGLGNALKNSRFKHRKEVGEGNHGPTKYNIPDTFVPQDDRLRSMTEDYTLGDYVTDAELNGRTFNALRGNVRIVDRAQLTKEAYEILHKMPEQIEAEERLKDRLRIPRRPHWDSTTTPEELHARETSELIEWRKALSILEEDGSVVLSPFEKNTEVWKELWRVLERSQVSVYIIDSRDPLSFLSEDFIRYMNELKLPVMVALNKADLVPFQIRQEWARYFNEMQDKLQFSYEFVSTAADAPGALRPKELVLKAKSMAQTVGRDGKVTIGFVGFPNVGKSSMLNATVGRNVCRSSSTPGKTKHLQTFNLEEDGITLCDCPGLVFPLFQQNRASMVCNGILPIDQMTDYRGPIAILCTRIPAEALNLAYGTTIKKKYADPEEFLQSLARIRGFMTSSGNPDEARVARYVLKDYATGLLLHCELPPGVRLRMDNTTEEVQETEEQTEEEEEEDKPALPAALLAEINKPAGPAKPAKATKAGYNPNPGRRGVVRITTL